MPLKINLDDLGPDEEEAFSSEGVRVGSLLVSPQGLSAAVGGPSYVLSPADLVMLPEKEGGFLGKGSSGAVWQAVHQRTGMRVAVKEIKVTSQAHLTEIRRELETLYDSTAQASPHMVDFYGAYTYEGSVFIAVECMDGTLADLASPLPLDVLAHVTRSVLRGLVYLHRLRHLIHRDLKPSNVLFKRATGHVKISDFGVSSNLECTKGDAQSFVGTVTYMSPERLKGEVYSYAADIWSLGLVVAELALGECPYPGLRNENVEARFWALLQHLSSPAPALELPDDMDPQLADFISQCVAKAPEDRPSCTSLLDHPFIAQHCHVDVGATSNPEVADQADRDAMKTWLESLAEKARRRQRREHRRHSRTTLNCGHSEDHGVAQSSSGVSYEMGDEAPGREGVESAAVAFFSSAGVSSAEEAAHRRGDATMSAAFSTAAGAGPAAAITTTVPRDDSTPSSGSNSREGTATTSEHPLHCRRRAEAEPSVNLDEELDKLLL